MMSITARTGVEFLHGHYLLGHMFGDRVVERVRSADGDGADDVPLGDDAEDPHAVVGRDDSADAPFREHLGGFH